MARRKPFRDHCASCGKPADPAISIYTLIGAGWRLTPTIAPDGRETMEMRCPECPKDKKCEGR